ncbi:MAG: hypothetical protein AAGC45_06600 [Bacteroidota bacterium]
MKKILAMLGLALIYNVNAQTSGQLANNQMSAGGANNDIVSYLLGDIKSGNEKRKLAEADIQGSAYTSDSFLPGQLFYNDEFESNVFYRYNAYSEEIEIRNIDRPDAPIYGLQRDKSISIKTPDGKSMSFKTFIDKKGLTQNGYLTLLTSGKYSLYKRSDVKYTQPQKAQNSFVAATPARFSKFTEYYLEMEGRNRIDELELKKGKLLKLVDDTERESLRIHLKENELKIKNEQDILNILAHLNKI